MRAGHAQTYSFASFDIFFPKDYFDPPLHERFDTALVIKLFREFAKHWHLDYWFPFQIYFSVVFALPKLTLDVMVWLYRFFEFDVFFDMPFFGMTCTGSKAPVVIIINVLVFVMVAFLIESKLFLFIRHGFKRI